jgi:hypothetical protein
MYRNYLGPFEYDEMYVPDYPSAQSIEVTIDNSEKVHWSGAKPYKIVTFITGDIPDQVFAFYKDKLLSKPSDGWRPNMIEQGPALFRIVGFGREETSPPMYMFTVTTEQKQGLTEVRVERYHFPGL